MLKHIIMLKCHIKLTSEQDIEANSIGLTTELPNVLTMLKQNVLTSFFSPRQRYPIDWLL